MRRKQVKTPLKNILVVAYHAPPSNASGTFRSLGFIRHLSDIGWQVNLLTVNVSVSNAELKENELIRKLPPSVGVFRAAHWDLFRLWARLPKRRRVESGDGKPAGLQDYMEASSPQGWWNTGKELISTFLKTPDQQIGWFWPAVTRCVSLPKPAIVYSSAPPFTGHLIGLFYKFFWRVPLVCDFRDPWIDNPFRHKKLPLIEKWDRLLERFVFSRADLVVANTEKMASVFRQKQLIRLPEIVTIPNGYDPEDFQGIEPVRTVTQDYLLLVHAGLLYGERNPVNFLKAMQSLAKQNCCPRLKVLLIGSSMPIEGLPLEEHIAEMGLSDYIKTQSPVPHANALSQMKGADALLLLALGTTLQVPAKLFEYFGLEKPVLSIAEQASATEEITAQLPDVIYSARNEPVSIQSALGALYKDWEEGKFETQWAGKSLEALLRPMQRQHQAKLLAAHLCGMINTEKE